MCSLSGRGRVSTLRRNIPGRSIRRQAVNGLHLIRSDIIECDGKRCHGATIRTGQRFCKGQYGGDENGSAHIHDAATGEERLAFYGLTAPATDVDISTGGTLIAAITEGGLTKVRDRQFSSAAALLAEGVICISSP